MPTPNLENFEFNLPPLPTLKPNGQGGYEFCPKCALLWLSIIFAVVIAVYMYRKNRS